MYSQNNEELLILSYFKDFKGTLLDLGANDGMTFSNSLKLIELGWFAHAVEPSPTAYLKLKELHKGNKRVKTYQTALSNENKTFTMYNSGTLLGKDDTSLVSTLIKDEVKRWKNIVKFEEIEIEAIDFKTFLAKTKQKTFDFVSIDIEGMDWIVLQQMDLTALGVKMLIVETNGIENQKFIDYVEKHDLKLKARNGENLIFTK